MKKETIKRNLRKDVISFLNDVEDNRIFDYQGLIRVILNYQSLSKAEILKIMYFIDEELRHSFSDTQEEIMIEVINSLEESPFGKSHIK